MAKPIGHYPGRQRPPDDWIIPGWLKRGNTGFMIGQPKKACKSWMLLGLAWDLAEGKPVWGITHSRNGPVFEPPRPMKVVYFAQEDTDDDIQDRVEKFLSSGNGRTITPNLYVVPKNLNLRLDTKEAVALIVAEVSSVVSAIGPIDLIIFDPMRRMHLLDENNSADMTIIWQSLDWFHRHYHCATLFSHHIVKPPIIKGNTFDITSPYAARGSGDIYAGGDAFINVAPVSTKGQPSTYQCEELYFTTKRSATPTPVRLRVRFDTGEIVFEQFL